MKYPDKVRRRKAVEAAQFRESGALVSQVLITVYPDGHTSFVPINARRYVLNCSTDCGVLAETAYHVQGMRRRLNRRIRNGGAQR